MMKPCIRIQFFMHNQISDSKIYNLEGGLSKVKKLVNISSIYLLLSKIFINMLQTVFKVQPCDALKTHPDEK